MRRNLALDPRIEAGVRQRQPLAKPVLERRPLVRGAEIRNRHRSAIGVDDDRIAWRLQTNAADRVPRNLAAPSEGTGAPLEAKITRGEIDDVLTGEPPQEMRGRGDTADGPQGGPENRKHQENGNAAVGGERDASASGRPRAAETELAAITPINARPTSSPMVQKVSQAARNAASRYRAQPVGRRRRVGPRA